MERNIKCKHCYSKKMCFETVTDEYSSFLCFRCGYMSDTRLKPNTEFLEKHLENTPYLVESLSIYDHDRELYWYPSVMNLGKNGVIFPILEKDTYKWKACKFIKTEKDKEFDKQDFLKTLKFLNIAIDINGKNTN